MMDVTELLTIVREEGLEVPVLYGQGRLRNDAVVLERDGDQWQVYIANERGGRIDSTFRTFDNESDALDYVLLKLRQGEAARRAMERMRARRAAQQQTPQS